MFLLSLQMRKLTHRQDKKLAKITWPVSGRGKLHIQAVSAAVAQGRLGPPALERDGARLWAACLVHVLTCRI